MTEQVAVVHFKIEIAGQTPVKDLKLPKKDRLCLNWSCKKSRQLILYCGPEILSRNGNYDTG